MNGRGYMKLIYRKLAAIIAASALLATPASALSPKYTVSESYMTSEYYRKLSALELTGVQRTDLLRVAFTQLGYHEGGTEKGYYDYSGGDQLSEGNCTEYNYYYYGWNASGDSYAWCAVFLSWCARQAGISKSVIRNYNRSKATAFGLIWKNPDSYTPLPGDAAFVNKDAYTDPDHTAIVYRVDDKYIYTIEGNCANAVRLMRYTKDGAYEIDSDDVVNYEHRIVSYGRPWYTTGSDVGTICSDHIYNKACEDCCAICGATVDTETESEDMLCAAGSLTYAYSVPYGKSAKTLYALDTDKNYHVTASRENSIGELWYALEGGGWVKADEVYYVYSPGELLPILTRSVDEQGHVSVTVGCVTPEAKLYIAQNGLEPDTGSYAYPCSYKLYSDEEPVFSVKAVYRGIESDVLRYPAPVEDEKTNDDGAALEAPSTETDEANETQPAEPTAGLENFTDIRQYIGLFADVSRNGWYAGSVAEVYELGLMSGTGAGRFDPLGGLTVAQAIAMAARLHSIYYGGLAEFIQSEDWRQVYVDYALENGIIESAPQEPDAPANRRQFVEIVAGALPDEAYEPVKETEPGSIADITGEENYVHMLYALYDAGILNGVGESGAFVPEAAISRAEAASILARMTLPELRLS